MKLQTEWTITIDITHFLGCKRNKLSNYSTVLLSCRPENKIKIKTFRHLSGQFLCYSPADLKQFIHKMELKQFWTCVPVENVTISSFAPTYGAGGTKYGC